MPSKSKKQRKFMRAAAHNPKFAKKAGIKQSVAKEYAAADARAPYAFGGGVLSRAVGRAAAPRIPPPEPPTRRDVRIPTMLRTADQVGRGAASRMRMMRAEGGKVKAIGSAAKKISELRDRWRESSKRYRSELPTLVDRKTGQTRKAKNWSEVDDHLWGQEE